MSIGGDTVMADLSPLSWWRSLLALPNTSPLKTVVVALLVSLICAVIVSATAVTLRPLQQANLEADRLARMQRLLEAVPGMEDLLRTSGVDSFQVLLVNLATGTVAEDIDPAEYDQRAAATDAQTAVAIPDTADVANLGQRAPYAPVYLVRRDDDLALVVLPVRGAGYQSMLYGYLALDGDLDRVAALSFYEQGETPGLGANIQDPAWEAKWPGTELVDENGEVSVAVTRGGATEPYQVDGISGATRTGDGVTNLIQFWLGDYGFGLFLERLSQGEIAL